MKGMRIALATTAYPPTGMGGIPRHRHILANAFTRLGHEVHVIVQGISQKTIQRYGTYIHHVPLRDPILFSETYPALNYRLTHSLAIQEQVRVLTREHGLDVLDAPLWGLEGFVPIYADTLPVVLWLQTSHAQLVEMGQQAPRPDDIGVIGLEKESLKRARGIIADSGTVLKDFEDLYQLNGLQERARVVHLGLPDLPESQPSRRGERNGLEVLLVGRLEKRKGTLALFDLLPELLRLEPRLRVRFIGADNSPWDGFQRETGLSYPAYFYQTFPGLRGRVLFEGQVSERRLVEAYQKADLMLVPSQYESFGLIYLEAMRAGLPIVTFSLGAAAEIFPECETDGAVVVSPHDQPAFSNAVLDLLQDDTKRKEIGACGRERFVRSFLDTRMAEQTAAYYRQVAEAYSKSEPSRPRRIFQVMEALDSGDAVSTIALNNADLLRRMGAGGSILGLHVHPSLAGKSRPIDQFDVDSHSALIFHYWNYSYLEDFIRSFPGPKAIHFHNITPPEFFTPGSPGYKATRRGYDQLPKILSQFDLLIGDSAYNLEACKPYLKEPKPGIVVPPLVEVETVRNRAYDAQLLQHLQQQPGMKLLFVGRIARNKRQERLVELLGALSRQVEPKPWLYLVGGDEGDPAFRRELEKLREQLPDPDHLVLTDKVSDEALYSYYRAADVFVSASEHEGFGLPIIEAMALDLPVVAYAAEAVPETMGGAGVLVQEWETEYLAAQVLRLKEETGWRAEVLVGQRENLKRFNELEVKKKLSEIVLFLNHGKMKQVEFLEVN